MIISEVQNRTGLTRKAIKYYEERGLINPKRLENGYRDYSDKDIKILKKISVLSKVGLSVAEIKGILHSQDSSLSTILRNKEFELNIEEKKKEILELIIKGEEQATINKKLDLLETNKTIYERLMDKFPGYFGQFLFSAYKIFLNENLEEEGKKAFEKYIEYLDNLPEFQLSNDEGKYIEELTKSFSMADLEKINESKIEAVNNIKKWFKDNEKFIFDYEKYKKSDEYLNSEVKKIQDRFQKYMVDNGYYEIAIPLIRKFSKSYDEYYKKLIQANKKYLKEKSSYSR
ncbi:MerR family transcriptional regulator [Anaerococcus sp. AGMB00486]|uniref:MerR family transcriptional regulator n=1 Tax=Anaerococcus faecalis TaxID=2742993 RepID=A0ABX2NB60_9FIRM|nr:MerR family transcriptional regulator [Anaerococcus faecalis]NVF11926.1 MerR family transcriptional regulator [Anaerococcus faecalis]